MKLVTQEAPMGCGIACAASLCGLSYKQARKLFTNGSVKDRTIGFYNKDFVEALAKIGILAKGYSAKQWKGKRIKPGTIVFSKRSKLYRVGHFLLKTKKGWMDPWKAGATIKEARAGWRKIFPGEKDWFIETKPFRRASHR
jgi:hypothetical protein